MMLMLRMIMLVSMEMFPNRVVGLTVWYFGLLVPNPRHLKTPASNDSK